MAVTFLPENSPPLFVETDTGLEINAISWPEIYDDWKSWVRASEANRKYPPLFRIVGGQDRGGGKPQLGITHFVQAPWKLRPAENSHQLVVSGNYVYEPAGRLCWVTTLGAYTVGVEFEASNLVDRVVQGSGVTAGDVTSIAAASAAASRDAILSDGTAFPGANIDAAVSSLVGQGLTTGQAASLSATETAALSAQAAAEGIDLATLEEQMIDVRRLLGLDPANPLVINKETQRQRVPADGTLIDLVATDNGTNITVTRQP